MMKAVRNHAQNMKTRIIQPLFAQDEAGLYDSFQWTLDALERCDPSLDLIVLPEFSDFPGLVKTRDAFLSAVSHNNARLLAACAATARRCGATLFVNAIHETKTGLRNTTHAFNADGVCVGRYDKQHVTNKERDVYGLDVSYTMEWSRPRVIEIAGVRYAFLTCYDFYFYENFANIARQRPDVVIGCSHPRSDRHDALETMPRFCAYNTAAYVIRASVSMGLDSTLGGCSMVATPSGEVIGNLHSQVGELTVEFDPHAKYLKPAGYGNPPSTHPEYVEIGRRPWKYRPAGSSIIPGFAAAPAKRICAHRGFNTIAPENSLPAFGAAVALGASEIEFDLWWTRDGEVVSIHDPTLDRVSDGTGFVYEHTFDELRGLDFGAKRGERFAGLRILRFEDILRKFSCHTLMNIHLKDLGKAWDEATLRKVVSLIYDYDAQGHVYFMTSCGPLQDQLARLAPDIPRCMGYNGSKNARPDIVDRAIEHRCQMVQLFKPWFDQSTVDRAHAAGIRCNVFFSDDPEEARRYLDMGIDTILTNDSLSIANATGLQ